MELALELNPVSLIGFADGAEGTAFTGMNPATGAPLEPKFFSASSEDLERAAALAQSAVPIYSKLSGKEKGAFLRRIAAAIEAAAPAIIQRANLETALPEARLTGEMGRTCNQLRFFAQVVEEGSWVDARIDNADPDRKPLPKPSIRSMNKPLGPVAVFGASNFPLAFSVAGGDTASALAAGNPVIVKAHPAHPGTSALVGHAVRESVKACGLPEGVFSLLFGSGARAGALPSRTSFTSLSVGGKSVTPERIQENIDVFGFQLEPSDMAAIDELGGPKYFNHYAWGWTHAGNTPFKRWKRETYRGGTADPFIVHWPKGIKNTGKVCPQFAHAIDMVPTVLDALAVEAPTHVRGVTQSPIEGVSFAETVAGVARSLGAPTVAK